jgi:hypothetical protein
MYTRVMGVKSPFLQTLLWPCFIPNLSVSVKWTKLGTIWVSVQKIRRMIFWHLFDWMKNMRTSEGKSKTGYETPQFKWENYFSPQCFSSCTVFILTFSFCWQLLLNWGPIQSFNRHQGQIKTDDLITNWRRLLNQIWDDHRNMRAVVSQWVRHIFSLHNLSCTQNPQVRGSSPKVRAK